MIKIIFLFLFSVFITEVSAQALGEDLVLDLSPNEVILNNSLDLSIEEVIVNAGNHYPEMGQEMIISCAQYLTPKTSEVSWNSVIGYYFSLSNVFDSAAVLMATDESSLGGVTQDEFDPERTIITLPDSIIGVGYIYVVSDYLHRFSRREKGFENNVVKIPLIIQESISGLEDEKIEDLLTLYPNPASNVLHVKSHVREHGQVFDIYDISGRVVKKISADQEHTSIDVSTLIAGIYFLHISGIKKSQKFIIN